RELADDGPAEPVDGRHPVPRERASPAGPRKAARELLAQVPGRLLGEGHRREARVGPALQQRAALRDERGGLAAARPRDHGLALAPRVDDLQLLRGELRRAGAGGRAAHANVSITV